MKIISDPKQMYKISYGQKLKNKTIGFVPTMGALHEGHLRLIRKCRQENDITVVSIFVNPTQFGPEEDFKHYPRPIKNDISLCRREGVDFIFYPKAGLMYEEDFKTYVIIEGLSDRLCGRSRPGHFRAVATVVTKLFNIVQPDSAYFGQKDFQQAVIIKRMARDLNLPLRIRVMPIVRENSGLALSSRNLYLSKTEREDALVLFQSLNFAKDLIKNGIIQADAVILRMKQLILKKKSAKIDYIAIVDPDNLNPVQKISGKCLIALAVWIGRTRLIDNMVIRTK